MSLDGESPLNHHVFLRNTRVWTHGRVRGRKSVYFTSLGDNLQPTCIGVTITIYNPFTKYQQGIPVSYTFSNHHSTQIISSLGWFLAL